MFIGLDDTGNCNGDKLVNRLMIFILLLMLAPLASADMLEGFHEPRPGLVTGGQPDQTQLEAFARSGGTLVIDLRTAGEERGLEEASAVAALGLTYLNLPIDGADDITADNAIALHQALLSATGPVLLHCASGNRVGALLALEAAAAGESRQQALDLAHRAGLGSLEPVVREHLGCAPETC